MRFICLLIVILLTAIQPVLADNKKNKHVHERQTLQRKPGWFSSQSPSRFSRVKSASKTSAHQGNPASYAVHGRYYQVLRSAIGYKKKGIASWYGSRFHKKRTSSGDHYDMYAMTAAHTTLPLFSYVKVRNLRNGREAVVKINDRGPFRPDRIIDLSYAAATKLGLIPAGTAPVEIEAISLKEASTPVARYFIQTGPWHTKKSAELNRAKIKQLAAIPVFIERYQKRYIVKAGPIHDKKKSADLNRLLKKKGIQGLLK